MANQTTSLSLINPNRAMLERVFAKQLTQIEPESTQPQSSALSTVTYDDRIRELAEKELLLKALRDMLRRTLAFFGHDLQRGNQPDQRLNVTQEMGLQNFVSGALNALDQARAQREAYTTLRLEQLQLDLDVNKANHAQNNQAIELRDGVQNVVSAFESGIQKAAQLNQQEEVNKNLIGQAVFAAERLHADLANQFTPSFPRWLPVPKAVTQWLDDRADRLATQHLDKICELTANPRKSRDSGQDALAVHMADLAQKGIDPRETLKAYQVVAQKLREQSRSIDRAQAKRAIAVMRDPFNSTAHMAAATDAQAAYGRQMSGDIEALIEGQASYRTLFKNRGNPLDQSLTKLQQKIARNPDAADRLSGQTQVVLESIRTSDWGTLGQQLKQRSVLRALEADAVDLQAQDSAFAQDRQVLTQEKTAVTNGLKAFRVGLDSVTRRFAMCFQIDPETNAVKRTASVEEVVAAVSESQRLYTSSTRSGPVFSAFVEIGDAVTKVHHALTGAMQGALKQVNNVLQGGRSENFLVVDQGNMMAAYAFVNNFDRN